VSSGVTSRVRVVTPHAATYDYCKAQQHCCCCCCWWVHYALGEGKGGVGRGRPGPLRGHPDVCTHCMLPALFAAALQPPPPPRGVPCCSRKLHTAVYRYMCVNTQT
jgi:hypothetical protein